MEKHRHNGSQYIETELGKYYICDICGERFVNWKRKIANLWVKQRTYQSQGVYYTSWIQGVYNTIQTGGVLYLVLGGDKARGIAIWIFIAAWLLQTIFETWIGIKDYKKWKVAQTQSTLNASYSPIVVAQFESIRNIEKKISPETYREKSILDTLKK